jgi:hypothetical protein
VFFHVSETEERERRRGERENKRLNLAKRIEREKT